MQIYRHIQEETIVFPQELLILYVHPQLKWEPSPYEDFWDIWPLQMSTHNSGSSFKCLEEAFEIYKNSPIDVDSFELVCGIVDNFLVNSKLENSLDLSEESVGSYCGISFKKDQLMYHCR